MYKSVYQKFVSIIYNAKYEEMLNKLKVIYLLKIILEQFYIYLFHIYMCVRVYSCVLWNRANVCDIRFVSCMLQEK